MKRWTVRVPDDIAETTTKFCALHGITLQSLNEAFYRALANAIDVYGVDVPVSHWEDDDPRVVVLRLLVERARVLDAEKRAR